MAIVVAQLLLQALVSFTTVAQGAVSAIGEPRQVVVRTTEEWQEVWAAHNPATPLPQVDFGQVGVVGVFLGLRPTDGFSVEIVNVRQENNRWLVEYRERRPAEGRLVGQVLTSPFHIVSLPLAGEAVEFERLGP